MNAGSGRRNHFDVGPLTVQPGTTGRGYVPYATRLDGSTIGIPVVVVHGTSPGPVLCVDASCHGDEHEGTMSVLRILEELEPSNLRGTFIGIPTLNVPAVEAMQRGNPFDHWNSDLNRLFPGTPDGNLTQRAANAYVSQIATKAQYSISIHSGASYIHWSPQGVCTQDPASVKLAQMLGQGWDILWQQGGEKAPLYGNSTAALNAKGVAAITIEVGGAAERMPEPFSKNVDVISGGIRNVMRHLDMLEGAPSTAAGWTTVRQVAVRSGHAGMVVAAPERRLRERVERGTPLVRLLDPLGVEVEVLTAPVDGYVMGFRTYQYAPPGWPLVWLGEVTGNL